MQEMLIRIILIIVLSDHRLLFAHIISVFILSVVDGKLRISMSSFYLTRENLII